ncbi:hypothetical protein GALL_382950 [mine drainage metagenome]|uniref:DUF4381 domain-containing protein n=1 Tax=mine drainage metagenome TaxID=410659 RepID=A0A1J5QJ07_9ZZZZ
MIDRIAALADIVPPAPAMPPPPQPWWFGPWGAALAGALLCAALCLFWAVWRTRGQLRALWALRRLQKRSLASPPGADEIGFAVSAALACAQRAGVEAHDLPAACRAQLDALRYQRPGLNGADLQPVFSALNAALRGLAWRRVVPRRAPASSAADASPGPRAKARSSPACAISVRGAHPRGKQAP